MVSQVDKINPAHYVADSEGIQAIDIIEIFGLNFSKGNVIKYTLRSGRKSEHGYDDLTKEIEDLNKAKWYVEREVERLEKIQRKLKKEGNK